MSDGRDPKKLGFRDKFKHFRSRSRSWEQTQSQPSNTTDVIPTTTVRLGGGASTTPSSPPAVPDIDDGDLETNVRSNSVSSARDAVVASPKITFTAKLEDSSSQTIGDGSAQPAIPKTAGELLWEKVYTTLSEKELRVYKELNIEFPQTGGIQAVLNDIHNEAENQKSKCDERETYVIFGKKFNLRNQAEKVVKWVSKVQDVGDILATLNPHAGIPWSVIKFLLKAGTADFEERARVIAGMESSWHIIGQLQVYVEFLEHVPAATKMRENYENAMLPLMTKLAKFLVQTIKVESQGGKGRRFFKAIWTIDQVEEFDTECAEHARKVESCAQACHRDVSRQGTEDVKKQLLDMMKKIGDVATFTAQLDAVQADLHNLWKHLDSEKRGKVLNWISDKDSESLQRQIIKKRVTDTCTWLLDDPGFQAWSLGVGQRLFWLNGHGTAILWTFYRLRLTFQLVGTGKTFLTSTVIERITFLSQPEYKTDTFVAGDEALAYCFCEKGDQTLNNESILRCLVKQLAVPTTE